MLAQPPPAAAVAAEIRRRQGGHVPVMKLHKLLYYVQGYHLAWEDAPAFSEEIEGWEKGPVVADLWRDEKRRGPEPIPLAHPLPVTVCNTITNVLRRFGHRTGMDLAQATHVELPWVEATRGGQVVYDQPITHEMLTRHFRTENPEVLRRKQALAQARDDSPFIPDNPGDLENLLFEVGLTP